MNIQTLYDLPLLALSSVMLWYRAILLTLFVSSSVLNTAAASYTPPVPPRCISTLKRREWRALSRHEKSEYIGAILCLQSLPARNPSDTVSRSRFDEFQSLHVKVADQVHLVGHFLAWHRYFMISYERALIKECGYEGANPYWDWTIDADVSDTNSIAKSPIFDPDTGFGGDGMSDTYTLPDDPTGDSKLSDDDYFRGCISDGPFAKFRPIYGPGKFVGEHCLTRGIDNTMKQILSSDAVADILAQPDFERFRIELEGRPVTQDHKIHDGGHISVGGEMGNLYSSPGDPLFFLHHANLDRIWWTWQHSKPGRLWEISGRSTTSPPYVNVTLGYPLTMGTLGNSIPIRDVMDTHASPGCYTYV